MPKYKRGSGSIYKKRGYFYCAYYVGGKQVVEATGTKDRQKARDFLHEQLGKIAEGAYVGPTVRRMTFDDLAALVVNDYRANTKKTLKSVERRLRLHLAPFFGGRLAKEITTADVTAFIVSRQAAKKRPSNAELNRELAILKRGFTLSELTRRPRIRPLEERNIRSGFFERADFDRLLAALPDYLRPLMTFAYTTGWRLPSEVLNLTWDRVDLLEGCVRLEPGTTKNQEARTVYLSAELQAVLEEQRRTRPDGCVYVFHRLGERIKDFRGAWDTACKAAGVAGRIPHDLRRTAVRNLVRAGVPERVAMSVSGHRTRSVFDRYNIVSEGDLREAAKRLDAALDSRTTTRTTTIDAPEASSADDGALTH